MQRFADLIRALVAYGTTAAHAEPERGPALRTWHAISNQIWLWNIVLFFLLTGTIAVFFSAFSGYSGNARWVYLGVYAAIPLIAGLLLILLFYLGNAPPKLRPQEKAASRFAPPSLSREIGVIFRKLWGEEQGRRSFTLHLVIALNSAILWCFAFIGGEAFAAHFLFPAALVLPFYFFRRKVQKNAWWSKGIWTGVILIELAFALWLVPRISPWLPLPAHLALPMRIAVFSIAGCVGAVSLAYFWWQLALGQKLLAWWERVSLGGVSEDMETDRREWMILVNRIIYLNLIYWVALYPAAAAIVALQMAILGELGRQSALLYAFTIAVVAGVAQSVFIIWINLRLRAHLSENQLRMFLSGALALTAFFWYANTWLYPADIPFGLFSILGIPLFSIIVDFRRNRLFAFSMTGYFIAITAMTIYQQFYRLPLIQTPQYMSLWIKPVIFAAVYLSITVIVFYSRYEAEKSKAALNLEREKNAELHRQSERLLLNILPAQVSEELKSNGRTTPREYASATVLFTDFVGFTGIAEKLTPVDLVRELDYCFSYFDAVIEKYGLEKLKTIGDAYMAAGGIPAENHTHALDCALAALEIQTFMQQMQETKAQQGLPYWELRLGMHTGPLVAGVVGEKKFAYDVWGDTVNTASRMESSGKPGAINISHELYEQVKFMFECEHRGRIAAKNKGEIEMYFIKGLKPKYSVSGLGKIPNGDFKTLYDRIKGGAKLVAKPAKEPGADTAPVNEPQP